MQQIQTPPVRRDQGRRRFVRLVPVMATGLAIAAAAAVVALGGTGLGRGGPAAGPQPATQQEMTVVARTLQLASATASSKPYTAPRPDQWIYIKSHDLAPSAIAKDKGQNPDVIREMWLKADGKQMAMFNEFHGKVESWPQDNGYPQLAALPTDPKALVSLLRSQVTPAPVDPKAPVPADGRQNTSAKDIDGALFTRIASILDQNLLPPAVTAALWRAAALVPGVTQADEPVQIDGRTAIAVGRVQEGWRFEQLLVDPDTYDYIGYRSVAVKDHTYFDSAPQLIEHAGTTQFALTRVVASIVDAPGRTS